MCVFFTLNRYFYSSTSSGALVQVPPTDSTQHTDRQTDRQKGTGEGSSSCTRTIISVAVHVLVCARTCLRFCIWSSYCVRSYCIAGSAVFSIPRYRHDENSLAMERLEGLPFCGPPHVVAAHGLRYIGHPRTKTRTARQSSPATYNNHN